MDQGRGGGGGDRGGITSHGSAAAAMTSMAQEVKAKDNYKGLRGFMEVVTFEKVIIGTKTVYSRVVWRENKVMEEYIYNRCSGVPANNICWEERKTSVLIYFVASNNKSQGRLFPSPSPSTP